LLTREEYDNTVRDLLGDDTRPARAFPAEPRVLGFENNPAAHQVNALLVAAYLDAAEAIAARAMVEHRDVLFGDCRSQTFDRLRCAEVFLQRILPRAFRRPPTPEELDSFRTFLMTTAEKEGPDTAVEWTLQVILQSPQFLYRFESGVPLTETENVLTPYEIASRLSYFLWSSMPDDALLAAAARGELSTPEGLAQHARRMLADPKARDSVHNFFRQWLTLDRIPTLEKDTAAFPEFTPEVAAAWREGIDLFIDELWSGDATLRSLLTSRSMYVDQTTAPLYGMSMSGDGFMRVDMTPGTRSGLITQPGLLAELAGPLSSSPVKRGVFVREKLLCETLAPPPAGVAVTPPDPDPGLTTRERFAEHEANPACAGCHAKIDPIGFGFEQYDALGRFRVTENGKPIDATGVVNGAKDPVLKAPFDGAIELGERLAASRQVSDCVATHWFRYALGRVEAPADKESLDAIRARFAESGGDFRELFVAIASSPVFRTRPAPKEAP
ncbi:MAG: DUF1592 domain-containing protein, partial [Myxococcaceae bacterium]|nr:DUF1592 domain-containing protein [Myxococcaceae bacterium]